MQKSTSDEGVKYHTAHLIYRDEDLWVAKRTRERARERTKYAKVVYKSNKFTTLQIDVHNNLIKKVS